MVPLRLILRIQATDLGLTTCKSDALQQAVSASQLWW
ncbi:hypothetical protein HaLaN_14118 [Haematococcus lacustris]|uniref:Uncharacterized protein n=1 Tax=Haematococcus lacustris TaxID=44745 RepID=A0A699Z5U3_HAELA|nr:hypothetical protein HaLaN_14118 [Haematococcus lacustris]